VRSTGRCGRGPGPRRWAARGRSRGRASQAGTDRSLTRAQIRGSRWTRSNASASRAIAAWVETPRAAAKGSGVNAATCGGAQPAQRFVGVEVARQVAQQAGVAPPGGAGVSGRGVQHAPLVGQPEPVAGGDAFGPVDLPHEGEQRVRAEVLDPVVVVPAAALIGLPKHSPRTVRDLRTHVPQGF